MLQQGQTYDLLIMLLDSGTSVALAHNTENQVRVSHSHTTQIQVSDTYLSAKCQVHKNTVQSIDMGTGTRRYSEIIIQFMLI